MRYLKGLTKPPGLFVFLSFLFGFSNFIDTFLRLLFFYLLHFPYPLGTSLKPLFFGLQTFCLIGFLFQMTSYNEHSAKPKFRVLLYLHFLVLGMVIALFFVYVALDPGKYDVIFLLDAVWRIPYVGGLPVTCFWFFAKLLREERFRAFSIIFLFVGLAFFTNFINQIYFWPQKFGYQLPPAIELITRYSPSIFMALALFYALIRLSLRKKTAVSSTSIIKLAAIAIALLLPSIWDSYRSGLINLIIGATIYFGLGYGGYGWYSVSLYLATFAAYIFLIRHLTKNLNPTAASRLVLLGVMSFPWNGLSVLDLSYSSIPGNTLSIDATITGFYLQKQTTQNTCASRSRGL